MRVPARVVSAVGERAAVAAQHAACRGAVRLDVGLLREDAGLDGGGVGDAADEVDVPGGALGDGVREHRDAGGLVDALLVGTQR